uniref:Immunoglobulin lambda variable 2-33 (non-functional) n=1 Tax=Macaca nemestrina TaxID=9545 RepID=A0A2K6ARG8_MACNE
QSALTEPPFVSRAPGQLVTISCTGTSSDRFGTTSRLLIYSVNTWPSGISDHFSGSKSGNMASLTISGLKSKDEANYHCSLYSSSYTFHSGPSSWGN